MDALLMCGGQGTRLDADVEKPLFPVGERPMVDRVREALEASRVGTVYAVTSPHAPETRAHLDGCATIETDGEGYVADLRAALEDGRVERPALTAVADLPLLEPDAVDALLDRHAGGSLTACVPAALKHLLSLSVDATTVREGAELAPAGLNIVGTGDEAVVESYDVRLAVNVNRRSDAEVAEALL